MKHLVAVLALAVSLSGLAAFVVTPSPVAAHHDACWVNEVNAPYKSNGLIRASGDVLCSVEMSQIDVDIEIYAQDCGTCTWNRWHYAGSYCWNCKYDSVNTSKTCPAGTTRSYYTRVRGTYLLYYGSGYRTAWKHSGVRTISC